MRFTNAQVFTPAGFVYGGFEVEDGRFAAVFAGERSDGTDLEGAASEREDVTAELICDGLHVHPSAVRMAFRLFPGRICLISDSLRCCGMPDGDYELGGQQVHLSGGVARLADGTIAGAAADLYTDMLNAVRFGIDREEAIRAATIRPAAVIGRASEIGSIEVGKLADFVVCGEDLRVQAVYINGVMIN